MPFRVMFQVRNVFLSGKPKEETQKKLPDPRYLLEEEVALFYQQVS